MFILYQKPTMYIRLKEECKVIRREGIYTPSIHHASAPVQIPGS